MERHICIQLVFGPYYLSFFFLVRILNYHGPYGSQPTHNHNLCIIVRLNEKVVANYNLLRTMNIHALL
jgi:hypothetical protein